MGRNHSPLVTALMLFPLVIIGAAGMDMYVPAVPHMQVELHESAFWIQLTLGIYLLGVGFGQLIFGPLSDAYGRRPVLLYGIIVYVISSIACALTNKIEMLVVMRFLQSLGSCCAIVVAFAIVRDLHSGEKCAQAMSYLGVCIALTPTVAPIIGGYITQHYSWHVDFDVLFVLGVVVLVYSFFWVRETNQTVNKEMIKPRFLLCQYLILLKNRQFLLSSLVCTTAFSVFFIFFSLSPLLIIDLLKRTEEFFGYIFGVNAMMLMAAGIFTARMVPLLGVYRMIFFGVVLMLLGGAMMLVSYWGWPLCVEGILLPMLVATAGLPMVISPSVAMAIEPFPNMAGTASAMTGCIRFALSAAIGSVFTLTVPNSILPLALGVSSCAVLTLLGSLLLSREKNL